MGSRYYDDQETDIQPGKISQELREALNIAENDVPIWIYRMRALGYPPGWLSKAKVDTSDIFDTDDVPSDGSAKKRKNSPEEIQYDHSKFIEYPGFNTPMPEGTTDYHYYYNMPPMLDFQQMDYAKKHTNGFESTPIPAKRHRSSPPDSAESKKFDPDSSVSVNDEIKLISKASPLPKLNERVQLERFSEGVVGDILFHESPAGGNFESIRGLLNKMRR